MNKEQLAKVVGTKLGVNKQEGIAAVEAVFDSIKEALINREEVNIVGHGKYHAELREAGKAMNPKAYTDGIKAGLSPEQAKQQAEVDTDEKYVAKFKYSDVLKKEVAQG